MSSIRVGVAGAIGRLTLARPEEGNALDVASAHAIVDALMEFEADDEVRVVLINADGPDFCTGVDLEAVAMADGINVGRDNFERDATDIGRIYMTIRGMRKPVVAAIQGRALGDGCGFATACDVVLARDDARFGYPEVRIGFVPAMVMAMLRRSVGEKQAFDLVMSGRVIPAVEAERIGLATRVLSAPAFSDAIERYVLGLAAHPAETMGMTKRLFYRLDLLSFREGIAEGIRTNVESRYDGDGPAGAPHTDTTEQSE